MHDETFDTIAAIATAPGEAGVAVIRISGPDSLAVADAVFRSGGAKPSLRPSHSITHGRVVSEDGEILDDALLLVFHGPKSFTGETVVEFQCHGGALPAARILRRLIAAGCRPAGPGEFSRRAFLNGRLDLTQAEAILDLIRAHSDRAAAAALEQLDGALGRTLAAIYDRVLAATSAIEAALDFPEEDTPKDPAAPALEAIRKCIDDCEQLSSSWYDGHLLRDGIRIVIAGRPNVGKSSLFNLLVGRDRAITSEIPGTTRDTIEEWQTWSGFGVRLVDTAGLRDSVCPIELDGINRSHKEMSLADLWIYVLESNHPPSPEDFAFVRRGDASSIILVANKKDLGVSDAVAAGFPEHSILHGSAMDASFRETIIEQCLKTIESRRKCVVSHSSICISERHRGLVDMAVGEFRSAADILHKGADDALVLAASHLRSGLESLGRITGRTYTEDLLDGIFSRFCIGK